MVFLCLHFSDKELRCDPNLDKRTLRKRPRAVKVVFNSYLAVTALGAYVI